MAKKIVFHCLFVSQKKVSKICKQTSTEDIFDSSSSVSSTAQSTPSKSRMTNGTCNKINNSANNNMTNGSNNKNNMTNGVDKNNKNVSNNNIMKKPLANHKKPIIKQGPKKASEDRIASLSKPKTLKKSTLAKKLEKDQEDRKKTKNVMKFKEKFPNYKSAPRDTRLIEDEKLKDVILRPAQEFNRYQILY